MTDMGTTRDERRPVSRLMAMLMNTRQLNTETTIKDMHVLCNHEGILLCNLVAIRGLFVLNKKQNNNNKKKQKNSVT